MNEKVKSYLERKDTESLDEKVNWDTVLSRPFDLNKDITLYRMSHIKSDLVYPFFKSVGNKLGGKEYVSWWAEQPDECTLHASQQIRILFPDYDEWALFSIVPDDGRGYKRSVLYIPINIFNERKDELNKIEIYRYIKKFKVKDLHRGQEYAIHE